MSKEMELAIKIAGKVDSSFNSALSTVRNTISGAAKLATAGFIAAGAAVGKIATNAVNVGREFESAMSQVQATMLLDTATEQGAAAYKELEDAARQCGRETAFSATEAAQALNYLALAGYDSTQAAEALPVVLTLAGAGAMELATASDMLTDAMGALQLEPTQENLESFADQMAKTASISNTSVEQLGEAILTVGGTAAGLEGGTAELMAMAGVLGDVGIKGSEAGTHIRNMINSLQTARNKDAAALFEEMQFSAYDANGELRSVGEQFRDINGYLEGMNAEQINSVVSTIFKQTDLAAARSMLAATANSVSTLSGVIDGELAESGQSLAGLGIDLEAMAGTFDTTASKEQFAASMMDQYGISAQTAGMIFDGLSAIVEGTGDRFGELEAAINDSAGAARQMYDIQLDNLNGDVDILNSAIDDLYISIAKDLIPGLRQGAQAATDMIGQLSTAYDAGGLQGMITAIGPILASAVTTVASYAPQFIDTAVMLMSSLVQGLSGSAPQLAEAAINVGSSILNGLTQVIPQLMLAGMDFVTALMSPTEAALPQMAQSLIGGVQTLITGIQSRIPAMASAASSMVSSLVSGLTTAGPAMISQGLNTIMQFSGSIREGAGQMVDSGIQIVMQLAQGLISAIPTIIETVPTIVTNIAGIINDNAPKLLMAGLQLIMMLGQGIIQAIPTIIANIPQILEAIVSVISAFNWLSLGSNIVKFISNGIKSAGKAIGNAIKSLFSGISGRSVASGLASIGSNIVSMIVNGLQALPSAIAGIFSSIGSIALNAIKSGGWATGLLSIFSGLGTTVSGALTTALGAISSVGSRIGSGLNAGWDALKNAATAAVDALPGLLSGGWSALTSGIEAVGSQIGPLLDAGWDALKTAASAAVDALPGLLSGGWSALTSGIEAVGSQIGPLLDSGWEMLKSNASSAIDAIMGIFDSLSSKVAGVIDTVKGLWEGFTNLIFGGDTGASIDATAEIAAAAAAGTSVGQAYSNGVQAGIIDMDSAISAAQAMGYIVPDAGEYSSYGQEHANAYTQARDAALAAETMNAGNVGVDGAALSATMQEAGNQAGTSFGTGMDSALNSYTPSTAAIGVDNSTLSATMQEAGNQAGTSFGTGMDSALNSYTPSTAAIGVDNSTLSATMQEAGNQAGTAFGTGMDAALNAYTPSTEAIGVDSSGLQADMEAAASSAGQTLTSSLESSISGQNLDMSSIGVDTGTLTATMTQAGQECGTALTDSLNTSVSGANFDFASAINIDAGSLSAVMGEAGTVGGEAFTQGLETAIAGYTFNPASTGIEAGTISSHMSQVGTTGGQAFTTALQAAIIAGTPAVVSAAMALGNGVASAVESGFQRAVASASSAMASIYSICVSSAQSTAAAIKAAFESISITVPAPSLPVISVGSNTVAVGGSSVTVPTFSVSWNALGGIFDEPTIFNTSKGMQGVGEAGPEAILPLDTLWSKMSQIMTDILERKDRGSEAENLLNGMQNTGSGNKANSAGHGGGGTMEVTYAPIINLYGSATQEDAERVAKTGYDEFKKFMARYQRDISRVSFQGA